MNLLIINNALILQIKNCVMNVLLVGGMKISNFAKLKLYNACNLIMIKLDALVQAVIGIRD